MAAIRRQINISASPRTVWRALTTSEGLASWYADTARVDPRQGGKVVLQSEDDEGNPVEERGSFLELRPVRKIEIKWDNTSAAATAGTRVEFQVARDGDETRVILVHSGQAALEDEAGREALDRMWRQALNALRDSLESE